MLERSLYNSFLSGVSLSGDRFFYPNVLESFGQHSRSKWFGCACCPPNVARLLPSLPGYFYAKDANSVYVNLYAENKASFEFKGSNLTISQKTDYPWQGKVDITVDPETKENFKLKVRIPGWARNVVIPGNLYTFDDNIEPDVKLTLNGEALKYKVEKGYAVIERTWEKGDVLALNFSLEVRKVVADSRVEANKGRIAIERGPIVFCAEWPYSEDGKVLNLLFDSEEDFTASFDNTLLNGVEVITTKAQPARYNEQHKVERGEKEDITLIPYYAWNNKGPGEMMVWLPVSDSSVKPMPAPTIASKSKVSASVPSKALIALNDQYMPKNSIDRSWPYYHWWPKNNSLEWIQYDFENTETISKSSVYWFDDAPFGGCRIPSEWHLEYKKGNSWVKINTDYPVLKDDWCKISFTPVKTKAVRLFVQLPEKASSGVHEWVIE
jgi:DUF1680 family protein